MHEVYCYQFFCFYLFITIDNWELSFMSRRYTLEDLHRMSWQEFETAAVDAVRRLYSKYDINLTETPFSKDGGRDGEAHHVLAVGLSPDLAITIKVFLEIKKRKNKNVGKSDLGSHVVDAFANRATKIIFITNREFTEPLLGWLESFCGPLNIQFSLVSGNRLLTWLNAPEEASSFEALALDNGQAAGKTSFNGDERSIQGQLTYTLDSNEGIGGTAPCRVRSDRPVFAIVDLIVGKEVTPFHSVVEIVPKKPGTVTIHRVGERNSSVIFSPGDRQRWVFAIWPGTAGRWDASCFEIILRDPQVPLVVKQTNVFHVPEQGLGVVLAESQNAAETAMRRSFEIWRIQGGLSLRFLLSPGGVGKSFIVGRLRKEWQAQGVYEVLLDGETVGDDVKLIERTFSSLFPFPKSPFNNEVRPALVRWLEGLNLSPEACEILANDLCCPSGLQPSNYSVSLRAQIFAALLAEASAAGGLVFVLEDLHKVSPSTISLLGEALMLLRGRGRGNIFALLTSRPARETGTPDITADWLARLKELSAMADDAVDNIYPLSKQDAYKILYQTTPSLEDVHVRQIVEQVGTIPFNLREAFLYLRQIGVLQVLGSDDRPVLSNPEKLCHLLEHEGLDRVTRRRLEVFFRDQPHWLRKLMEAGACYGRQFPFLTAAEAVSVSDWDEAMDAIGEAARWSLMALSSDQRENLEFDHDMVRAAILALLPDIRRRELADALLSLMESYEEPSRMAGLAYQAGHADKAFDLARLAAREQRKRGRPADALKANHIALLTLDPNWAEFNKRSSSWVDIGIQSSPVCRRIFSDWRERDTIALAVLRDNLQCLGSASSGSSGLSDAILTEARMLSQRLVDQLSNASLIAMEGRLLFERNDIEKATSLHEEAERIFAAVTTGRSADRAENLVRLAICLRQTGRIEESLKTLNHALKYRARSDWNLLNKVLSNTGAAYLRTDWDKVRHYWERQLRSARLHGLVLREAHALVGLSFINLFDGRRSEGRQQAETSLEIAKMHGLDNTRLRCDLNLSVSSLIDGSIEAALNYLNEAESIAIQHQIGRRLWRVYANLATAHELNGDMERARVRDLHTLNSLGTEAWSSDDVLRRGRNLLPVINVAFRAILAPELYRPVFDRGLQPETALAVQELAGRIASGEQGPFGGVLLKYLVEINGIRRFLLTE
jgi:tetratricopeptide (TPR) repeat protein